MVKITQNLKVFVDQKKKKTAQQVEYNNNYFIAIYLVLKLINCLIGLGFHC